MSLRETFDKKLGKLLKAKGLIGVFYSPTETKEVFFGYRYNNTPVDKHTKFQAASISKFVGSLVSLMFLEKHKISPNEVIADKLLIKVSNKTTLKNLLSHSAGINVHGFAGYSEHPEFSIKDIISGDDKINHDKIEFNLPFGEYSYSGGGYCLAQYYIENLANKPFSAIATELLFSPLGLNSTTYNLIDADNNCAHGHTKDGKPVSNGWHYYPESIAAGLWTSANELLIIIREFMSALNGDSKIISREVAQTIIEKNVDYEEDGSHCGYGLGIRIYSDDEYGHDGSNAGFKSRFEFNPKTEETFVIMTNDDNAEEILFEKE